jgi:hypothetical protein
MPVEDSLSLPQTSLTCMEHQSMTPSSIAAHRKRHRVRPISPISVATNGISQHQTVHDHALQPRVLKMRSFLETSTSETIAGTDSCEQCQQRLSHSICLHQAKHSNPGVETHVLFSLIVRPSVDRLSPPHTPDRKTFETDDCSLFDIPLLILFKPPWRIRRHQAFPPRACWAKTSV